MQWNPRAMLHNLLRVTVVLQYPGMRVHRKAFLKCPGTRVHRKAFLKYPGTRVHRKTFLECSTALTQVMCLACSGREVVCSRCASTPLAYNGHRNSDSLGAARNALSSRRPLTPPTQQPPKPLRGLEGPQATTSHNDPRPIAEHAFTGQHTSEKLVWKIGSAAPVATFLVSGSAS